MKNLIKPRPVRGIEHQKELDRYELDLDRIRERHTTSNARSMGTDMGRFDLIEATGPLRAPFNPLHALSERISSLTALLPTSRPAKQDLFEVLVNINGNSAAMADNIALADICMKEKKFVMATKLLCPPEEVKDVWTLYSRSIQLYYEPLLGIRNESGEPVPNYCAELRPFPKVLTFAADYTSERYTKYTYPRRLDCDGRPNLP